MKKYSKEIPRDKKLGKPRSLGYTIGAFHFTHMRAFIYSMRNTGAILCAYSWFAIYDNS